MDHTIQPPKRVETSIEARCARCKRPLYTEVYVEENRDGALVEVEHRTEGVPNALVCSCK